MLSFLFAEDEDLPVEVFLLLVFVDFLSSDVEAIILMI
jgi:hypothetical protein